jgi:hypothetical protein
VTFFVTLSATAGEQVAATEITIGFEAATPVVQCTPNPSFPISQCALQPTGCTPGVDCQQTQCLTVAFGGTIPSGSVLYVCNVDIAANAAGGEYALSCSSVDVSDSAGHSLNPQCTDGQVEVVSVPTPTPTPPSQSYTVCDVNRATASETGDDVGDFGDGSIDIFDYKAIFNAAQLSIDAPAAGTARFSAMDSSPTDAPPACGGDGMLNIFDVRQCFEVGQLGFTSYVRTGECPGAGPCPGSCTSAVAPQ